jgi:hypothetical protein
MTTVLFNKKGNLKYYTLTFHLVFHFKSLENCWQFIEEEMKFFIEISEKTGGLKYNILIEPN